MSRPQGRGRVRLWRAPVALGVLTALGLIAALLADGAVDALSAAALAAPLATAAWFIGRRDGSR
ncbi:MAG: hypothetical protein H0W48_13120 [Methylibium sp.]|nr:hypothetical protein [Methylibium sp.]